MSLLPHLSGDDFLSRCPSRILEQHFGLGLNPEDFLQLFTVPRLLTRSPAGYLRNWIPIASQQDSGSTVLFDNAKFQANLDVQQFKPEELSVKLTGENTITIEGKHEEKEDEHGHIYRHFIRRYLVPRNYDMSKVESKLSSDGILTICAPKIDTTEIEYRDVPVTQTGTPAKPTEKKCGKNPGKKCEDVKSCCGK